MNHHTAIVKKCDDGAELLVVNVYAENNRIYAYSVKTSAEVVAEKGGPNAHREALERIHKHAKEEGIELGERR